MSERPLLTIGQEGTTIRLEFKFTSDKPFFMDPKEWDRRVGPIMATFSERIERIYGLHFAGFSFGPEAR